MITKELALQILRLALNNELLKIDDVEVHSRPTTFDRYTEWNDVFASMFVFNEKELDFHFMIMKNGDIHGRLCPYYDGDRSNMLMIHNQAKIHKLIAQLIDADALKAEYNKVIDEIKKAFYNAPLALKYLPYQVKELILPPGYETTMRLQQDKVLGFHLPEVLTFRGVTVRTVETATTVIVQAKDPAINAHRND